jgi:sec-independent protein translocase protein TatC
MVKKRSKDAKKPKPSVSGVADRMSLTDHLRELRQRIVKSVLAVALGMLLVWLFYDPIVRFLAEPYRNLCVNPKYKCDGDFLMTEALAPFAARLRVCMWGGIILSLPILLWQIYQFVIPALHKKEKKYVVPFVLSTVILFFCGSFIAYISMQPSLEFFVDFAGPNSQPKFTIDRYLDLLTLMMLGFGIGFLFPVLLVFLQLLRVLKPKQLLEFWRQALVIIIILAAVITPGGDPFSLFALGVPMCLLYFVAILVGYFVTRKQKDPAPSAT